jgi:hypothetical protein
MKKMIKILHSLGVQVDDLTRYDSALEVCGVVVVVVVVVVVQVLGPG